MRVEMADNLDVAAYGLNLRKEFKEDFKKEGYEEINLASSFIEGLMDNSSIYLVEEKVTARQITQAEEIYKEQDYYSTWHEDWIYKSIYAYPGDWVVSKKDGGCPIVSDSEFKKTYIQTAAGEYILRKYFRAIQNPYKKKIFAQPNLSRGTVQFNDYVWSMKKGEADCWIIEPCREDGRRSYEITLSNDFQGVVAESVPWIAGEKHTQKDPTVQNRYNPILSRLKKLADTVEIREKKSGVDFTAKNLNVELSLQEIQELQTDIWNLLCLFGVYELSVYEEIEGENRTIKVIIKERNPYFS